MLIGGSVLVVAYMYHNNRHNVSHTHIIDTIICIHHIHHIHHILTNYIYIYTTYTHTHIRLYYTAHFQNILIGGGMLAVVVYVLAYAAGKCITIIDTIILTNYTNNAYISDT
jgi:hypothetical protein